MERRPHEGEPQRGTRRERRMEVEGVMVRRKLNMASIDLLTTRWNVCRGTILRDCDVILRRWRIGSYGKVEVKQRLKHLSRKAEEAGELGIAVQAETTLAKCEGMFSSGATAVAISQSSSEAQIQTFADLARRARNLLPLDSAN